jgi:hypothetical protein
VNRIHCPRSELLGMHAHARTGQHCVSQFYCCSAAGSLSAQCWLHTGHSACEQPLVNCARRRACLCNGQGRCSTCDPTPPAAASLPPDSGSRGQLLQPCLLPTILAAQLRVRDGNPTKQLSCDRCNMTWTTSSIASPNSPGSRIQSAATAA